MIHPSRLLRSDSSAADKERRIFSAPMNINSGLNNNYDCGITALPCISERLKLYKYAKIGIFIFLVAFLGLLQSIAFSYFKGTSQVWMKQYGFNDTTTDWLIYSCDVFGGAFALLISYWGNRIQRATWLGTLAIFHAISASVLIIPELYHPGTTKNSNITRVAIEQHLCLRKDAMGITEDMDGSRYIALVFICIYQLFHSFSIVSFLTHGITYIDDHIGDLKKSPIVICILLLAFEVGSPIGSYLTWIPTIFNKRIFLSFAWLNIAILIFIVGFFIALFPKVLPSTIINDAAARILNENNQTQTQPQQVKQEQETSFFAMFKRVFINKVIIINAISVTLMSIAVTNFRLSQNDFFRTRFVDVSSGSDYKTNLNNGMSPSLIMQPITSSVIMMSGFLITKFKPAATLLVTWNTVTYILIAMSFASYGFLKCEENIFQDYGNIKSYCNFPCDCSTAVFYPVCGDQLTYFSPCWAGCKQKIGDTFTDCGCLPNNATLSIGSCNAHKCEYIKIFAQSSGILTDGLLSSGIITHLLINLRSIPETDKALALGLHYTFIKLLPYVPFKIFYNLIKDSLCLYEDDSQCIVYKYIFPTILSTLTFIMMLLSAALAFLLIFFIKDLNLYEKYNEKGNAIIMPLETIHENEESIESSARIGNENDPHNENEPHNENDQLLADENKQVINKAYSVEDIVNGLNSLENERSRRRENGELSETEF